MKPNELLRFRFFFINSGGVPVPLGLHFVPWGLWEIYPSIIFHGLMFRCCCPVIDIRAHSLRHTFCRSNKIDPQPLKANGLENHKKVFNTPPAPKRFSFFAWCRSLLGIYQFWTWHGANFKLVKWIENLINWVNARPTSLHFNSLGTERGRDR